MQSLKKIIFLITFSPKYEEYKNETPPKWRWEKSDGEWVGIWGYDWGDQIGSAIVKHNPNIKFEVWQLDKRADKVYSAEIHPGLIHKNYPAVLQKMMLGIKPHSYQSSLSVIHQINALRDNNTVFLLPATVETPFTRKTVNLLQKKNIPFIHYNLLNSKLLLPTIEHTNNPVKTIHRFFLAKKRKKHLQSIQYLLSTRDNSFDEFLNKFIKYAQFEVFEFSLGVDLSYWNLHMTEKEAKAKLGIHEDEFVIFLSQRVVPNYQIDKFIIALSKIKTNRKFSCYISGFCEPSYKEHLECIIQESNLAGKVQPAWLHF